jgi:hypothetical protein
MQMDKPDNCTACKKLPAVEGWDLCRICLGGTVFPERKGLIEPEPQEGFTTTNPFEGESADTTPPGAIVGYDENESRRFYSWSRIWKHGTPDVLIHGLD